MALMTFKEYLVVQDPEGVWPLHQDNPWILCSGKDGGQVANS